MESVKVEEQMERFLAAFIEHGGLLSKACTSASVDKNTFFTWLQDPEFEGRYQIAREIVFVDAEAKNRLVKHLISVQELYEKQQEYMTALIDEQGKVIVKAWEHIRSLKARIAGLEGTCSDG